MHLMISTPVKNAEFFPIEYVQLSSAAELSGELLKSWLKIILAEEDARQFQMVELATEQFRFDEWRAKDLRMAVSCRDLRRCLCLQ